LRGPRSRSDGTCSTPDGERVGEVSEVHDTAFTLETVGGSVEVDFTDVESADDGRVTLNMSGEELTADLAG
jgi:hypothetical protein